MKKILLVALNAKYIHSNLAIYSLRAYAKQRGQEVSCLEFTINQSFDQMMSEIYLQRPDVLAFSCYIWNIELVKELIREYSRICKSTEIWVGGPEVSYETETFLLENPAVKGIMVGEGEETFYQLCKYYRESETDLLQYSKEQSVEGIVWREPDKTIRSREKTRLLPMDELPFCYENLDELEHRIVYYESSRGCPFSCSYCLSSVDKHLRMRSLKLVYPELQYFLDHKVPQVKFVDRTFNCNHDHACKIWRYLLEHDNGITNFHFEISAELLNEEELTLLSRMRPGLIQLEIGVQTTNPQTLGEIRRHTNLKRLSEVVGRIRAFGNIHQHLDLIAGLPYEDYASFIRSFDEVYRMYGDQLQLGFLKVLKGSYMYEMAETYGMHYRRRPPYEVLENAWISYEDMLKIKTVEEMLEIHYNSGQFATTVALLETNFDSPFRFYLELGRFYEEQGCKNICCSRLTRVELLRQFAYRTDAGRKEIYEDALIHDLFLREKSKARPPFAYQAPELGKEVTAVLSKHGYERRYCHAERFRYPVWEIHAGMRPEDIPGLRRFAGPVWVIYDYEHRRGDRAEIMICEN